MGIIYISEALIEKNDSLSSPIGKGFYSVAQDPSRVYLILNSGVNVAGAKFQVLYNFSIALSPLMWITPIIC